jgi:hypothetical protein
LALPVEESESSEGCLEMTGLSTRPGISLEFATEDISSRESYFAEVLKDTEGWRVLRNLDCRLNAIL